ncbi:cytochrome P450 [Actinoplanes awajinensis]|nr:cytochrome P450 [Actinoplanes awajinensis]
MTPELMRRARRRDRRVYLFSHPLLFALLTATRRWPVQRLGGTVLVHSRDAFRDGLTRIPLDRSAAGTTGGAAGELTGGELLFNQDGAGHRGSRRTIMEALGAEGVHRLRPVWTAVLDHRLAPLAAGAPIDLVDVAAELAGATTAALLGLSTDPHTLAAAARTAAAAAAREHLPGRPRRRAGQTAARTATAALTALLDVPAEDRALAAMLAVAAINTTVAALPRAVAWCADADLWSYADSDPDALTSELFRVTAPTPLLPRVAAGPGTAGGCPVRAGDRLVLVARHAADAHRTGPCPADPAPASVAQLVFGLGAHACPGARLARLQLTDTLRALARHRPRVVSARVDRRSALPGWSRLIVAATR